MVNGLLHPLSLSGFSLRSLKFPLSHFSTHFELQSHFHPKLNSRQFLGRNIHVAHRYSVKKFDSSIQFWMQVKWGSNFEDRNEMNGTLRTEVRKHANFKGIKGQLP